jgi:hypothetical protein
MIEAGGAFENGAWSVRERLVNRPAAQNALRRRPYEVLSGVSWPLQRQINPPASLRTD